ncbi:hypothetical protein LTR94_028808, partial [Friedmanniomyces endolithicus]
ALKAVKIPVTVVQADRDELVWKQTSRWAAKRLERGRYVEIPGARHEIIMEADDMRAVFLQEFDALADTITHSPEATIVACPSARTHDVTA